MTDINDAIRSRIDSFANELAHLVRQSALEAVTELLSREAGSARPTRVIGRTQVSKGGPRGRIRRSSEDIEQMMSSVLDYVKAHPSSRAEAIRKAMDVPRPVLADALRRLVSQKKVKSTGEKRATEYSAR